MAEQLTAQLSLDLSQFSASLQAAANQVATFAQQVQQKISAATTTFQAQVQQMQQMQTTTTQLSQGMQTLTQAVQQQSQATQQLTQAVQQQGQATAQVTTAVQQTTAATQQATSATHTWHTALGVLAGLGIATSIRGIISALTNFATQAVSTATTMQSLNLSINAVTGNTKEAAAQLDFLRGMSNRLGLDFLSLTTNFRNFQAASVGTSFNADKVRIVFTGVSEAARVMGLSNDQVKHAFLALEQMMQKGVVTSEELRKQFANAMPGGLQIFAEAMGVSVKEMMEMVKTGTVLSEEVLPKVGQALHEKFGQAATLAADTAIASFARFTNNMRDVASSVGETILALIKPVVDLINQSADTIKKANKHWDRQTSAATGDIPGNATPQEREQLTAIGKELANLKFLYDELAQSSAFFKETRMASNRREAAELQAQLDVAKALIQKRKELEDAIRASSPTTQATEIPFKQASKEIDEALDQMAKDLAEVQVRSKHFLSTDELKVAQDALRAIDLSVKSISAVIASNKGLQIELTPDIQKKVTDVNAQLAAAQKAVDAIKDRQQAAKDAARDAEKLENERVRLTEKTTDELTKLNNNSFDADLKLLDLKVKEMRDHQVEETIIVDFETKKRAQIVADQAAYERSIDDQTTKQRQKVLDEIAKAQAKSTRTVIDDMEQANAKKLALAIADGANTMQQEELKAAGVAQIQEKQRELEEKFQADLAQIRARGTKTQLDDLQAALDKKLAMYEREGRSATQLAEFAAAAQAQIARKALDEQAAEWKKLGGKIESSLSSAFQSILTGSKSVFDLIKDAFIKLIADLAAYAITHQILLSLGLGTSGTTGTSSSTAASAAAVGGSTLGTIVSLLGGTSTSTTSGGSSTLSTASSALTVGSAASGALGGPTTGSLLSSAANGAGVGKTGIGTFVNNVGGTVLFSTAETTAGLDAAASGTSAVAAAGGGTEAATLGAGYTITLGQAAVGLGQAIAVGIAVDAILLQINDALGIKGKAGGALAGAGAGAAAGAIAGTIVFPGVGTGIGAAIGTVLGALIGWFTSSGPKKDAEFALQGGHAGKVGLDPYGQIEETLSFQLLFGEGKNLGGIKPHKLGEALTTQLEGAFQSALSTASGFTEKVQKALVDPINTAAEELFNTLEGRKFKGQGEKLQDALENFSEKELPDLFQNTIGKFIDAAKRIDPLISDFDDFIADTQKSIDKLKDDQATFDKSLDKSIKDVKEATFTNAQLFEARKRDLAALKIKYDAASPAGQLALVPEFQTLIAEIIKLGKGTDVLGQDPGAVAQLQNDLVKDLGLLKEGTDKVYTNVQDALNEQIDLANQQIDALLDSLVHLDNIDAAISSGQTALTSMKAITALLDDSTLTQSQFSKAIVLQLDALVNIEGISRDQLKELQRISGVSATGGSTNAPFSADSGGADSFQHGTGYVSRNMLARLHEGEAVIPAYQNHGARGAITININGATEPNRVADEVMRRIERQGDYGNTRILTRKH